LVEIKACEKFYRRLIVDGFVKSPKFVFPVIPANDGIQYFQYVLDAGVRRHDASATFYGLIIVDIPRIKF